MSSNVGLSTPRGSGTSGYVQKNLSFRPARTANERKPEREDSLIKQLHRKPDPSILEHEKLRKLENTVFELRVKLEDEGVDEDEINKQCDELRAKLEKELNNSRSQHAVGPRGLSTGLAKESFKPQQTHLIAEAQHARSEQFRKALRIPESYRDRDLAPAAPRRGLGASESTKAKPAPSEPDRRADKGYQDLDRPSGRGRRASTASISDSLSDSGSDSDSGSVSSGYSKPRGRKHKSLARPSSRSPSPRRRSSERGRGRDRRRSVSEDSCSTVSTRSSWSRSRSRSRSRSISRSPSPRPRTSKSRSTKETEDKRGRPSRRQRPSRRDYSVSSYSSRSSSRSRSFTPSDYSDDDKHRRKINRRPSPSRSPARPAKRQGDSRPRGKNQYSDDSDSQSDVTVKQERKSRAPAREEKARSPSLSPYSKRMAIKRFPSRTPSPSGRRQNDKKRR